MSTSAIDNPVADRVRQRTTRPSSARTVRPALFIQVAGDDEHSPPAPGWMDRCISLSLSLLLHLSLLLILAATLLTRAPQSTGTAINSRLDADDGESHAIDDALFELAESKKSESQEQNVLSDAAIKAAGMLERLEVDVPGPVTSTAPANEAGQPEEGGGDGNEGGGSVGFFGTEATGNSFVFILDCSGSMKGYRFTRAVRELHNALQQLNADQRFYVIFYNHNSIPMFLKNRRLVRATADSRSRAVRWILQRRAGGGTLPQGAVSMALRMKPEVIFFLTDGEIPRSTRTVAQDVNKSGTIIHTIAFGFRGGETIMQGIAADHNGRYRFVQ